MPATKTAYRAILDNKINSPLMTPAEAADYLRTTTGTLAQWRYLGEGPRFHKIGPGGRKVVYAVADLDTFAGLVAA